MKIEQNVTARQKGFRIFQHAVFRGAQAIDLLAAAAIVGMMVLTCADVALRFFRRPITGTYEVVAFLGALAVSLAIAHTSAEKGHVAVNLVVRLLPARVRGVVEACIALLSLALFALIAWQTALYGAASHRVGEVSLTLQFPLYPIIYGIAFGTGAVCVICLVDLCEALLNVFASAPTATGSPQGRDA